MLDTAIEIPAEPAQPPLQAERQARLLVAGSPALARRLAQQLPKDWEVTLVGPDRPVSAAEGGDEADGAADGFTWHQGDPTSAIVLQRAGAVGARALVAALPDAEANVEVCRLAREKLEVPNVLAVAPSPEVAEEIRGLGFDVLDESTLVATAVRNHVQPGVAAAQDVGLGRGELVEITLQPTSPVIGRRLRAFRPRGWAVAAVFRDDELLLPQPETLLQANDRVLLVGQPDRLSVIAEYLRLGRARFPLPYGGSIAGPVWGEPSPTYLQEVAYLAAGVGVSEITLVAVSQEAAWRAEVEKLDLPLAVRWAKSDRRPADAVSETLSSFSPGCLVVPGGSARLPRPFAGLTLPLERALREASVPVLVPRGTFPYERILFPVVRLPIPPAASQAALDLAEQLNATVVTVNVQAPAFLTEHGEERDVVAAAVDEMAGVRHTRLEHRHLIGNPLTELRGLAGPNQLAVLSHRRGRRWRSLRPDISAYLAQRFAGSVLVLPVDA